MAIFSYFFFTLVDPFYQYVIFQRRLYSWLVWWNIPKRTLVKIMCLSLQYFITGWSYIISHQTKQDVHIKKQKDLTGTPAKQACSILIKTHPILCPSACLQGLKKGQFCSFHDMPNPVALILYAVLFQIWTLIRYMERLFLGVKKGRI